MEQPASETQIVTSIRGQIETVVQDQSEKITLLLAAFFTGSHVLLEDTPGTGKTTLAKALAHSISLKFKRLQFTPDLLPSDITGLSMYNQKDQEFEFHPGPVFTDILLADEINRASPRTQSALLEAMGEGQVTIDGQLHKLSQSFFVIATQNPLDSQGTYPLPDAQLDRFGMSFQLGYVSRQAELDILKKRQAGDPLDSLSPLIDLEQITHISEKIEQVVISDDILGYIIDVVRATRKDKRILVGLSPRATLTLMRVAKALALFSGYDYVVPEHVQQLCVPVLGHRIAIEAQARFAGTTSEQIIDEILQRIDVPT